MRVHIGNRTTQGLCGKRISRKKKEGKKQQHRSPFLARLMDSVEKERAALV